PHIRVFSGKGSILGLYLHDTYVNITGPFSISIPPPLQSFFAYDVNFTGGVRVGAGDVDGDDFADIITGAGPGGGPHVRVFSGASGDQLPGTIGSFMAFADLHILGVVIPFNYGVYVSAGDVDGDGHDEVIVGTGAFALPQIRVFGGPDAAVVAQLGL